LFNALLITFPQIREKGEEENKREGRIGKERKGRRKKEGKKETIERKIEGSDKEQERIQTNMGGWRCWCNQQRRNENPKYSVNFYLICVNGRSLFPNFINFVFYVLDSVKLRIIFVNTV
jgi:hypothetical protein